jgi:hypothetical protein
MRALLFPAPTFSVAMMLAVASVVWIGPKNSRGQDQEEDLTDEALFARACMRRIVPPGLDERSAECIASEGDRWSPE